MRNHQDDFNRAARHIWYAVALVAALLCGLVGMFFALLWIAL